MFIQQRQQLQSVFIIMCYGKWVYYDILLVQYTNITVNIIYKYHIIKDITESAHY